MNSWMKQAMLVAFVAGTVLFTNLGHARLWDRDEPRNAGCALEMLARGDWVTPVFNGELRAHKPVLLYWLMMSAYELFGVGEFAARFWSALAGTGTALATYAIGRRLFGGAAATWAGVALSSNLLFGLAGRAATPDAIVIFLSTLSIAVYIFSTFAPRTADSSAPPQPLVPGRFFPVKWTRAALIYAVMGLAMLAKGPVGLVLPTAVIGMFLLIMRLPDQETKVTTWPERLFACLRPFSPGHFLRTCWVMRPLTAIAVSLAVAAPWYVWVAIRTDGEFLRGFFWEHNVGRAMQTMEGHSGGPLFYPAAILVGFFPWSVFAVPLILSAIVRVRANDRCKIGYLFAACWVGVYVTAFSIAKTKLPSYITPCFPGVALATGAYFYHWTRGNLSDSMFWRRLAFSVLLISGVGISATIPFVAQQVLPGEAWLGVIGALPFAGGIAAWLLMEKKRHAASALAFSVSAVCLIAFAFAVIPQRVARHQRNGELLAAIEDRGTAIRLASFGLLEPTWVFYGGRSVEELHASGERKWIGNWIEVDCRWRPKPPLGIVDVASSQEDWLIITSDEHLEHLGSRLPGEFEVLAEVPYFLKDKQLVLLGRPARGDRIGKTMAAPTRR